MEEAAEPQPARLRAMAAAANRAVSLVFMVFIIGLPFVVWSWVGRRTLFNILPAIVWKTGCLRHSVSCVCPPLVHRSVYSPGKNKRTCLCPWRCHEQGQVLNFFKTCGATLLASPKTEATSPGANTPCLCNGRYPAQTTESACALFALPSAVHFRPFGPLPRSLPGSQQPGLSGSALCSFISASSV